MSDSVGLRLNVLRPLVRRLGRILVVAAYVAFRVALPAGLWVGGQLQQGLQVLRGSPAGPVAGAARERA